MPTPGETPTLGGSYTLGPGRYRVDWLMRNSREEVCADHWEIETRDVSRHSPT